ncbi:RHS repeat-associated core domain-containing protein, partial [Delftia sp. RIT313]
HHDRETGLYYNRHRYYDPVVGSYINQDPMGLSGGINLSIYIKDPNWGIDPLGLWGSQKGAYVHQRAGYLVYGKEISLDSVRKINDGQIWADAPQHQTGEYSYMHAMRNSPHTSIKDACSKTNEFINKHASEALAKKKSGNMDEAYFHFGAALHAMQDSTSPSHRGFQVWSGEEGFLDKAHHVSQEIVQPGENSDLRKITEQAWKGFKGNDINAFKITCGCD